LAQQLSDQPLDFLLAIGDSWFDYPLNGDTVSFSNTDIRAQLQNIGNPPPPILIYAVRGQQPLVDPSLPFKTAPVNGREARKSGLSLKA
jgi:hypothetical protein